MNSRGERINNMPKETGIHTCKLRILCYMQKASKILLGRILPNILLKFSLVKLEPRKQEQRCDMQMVIRTVVLNNSNVLTENYARTGIAMHN